MLKMVFFNSLLLLITALGSTSVERSHKYVKQFNILVNVYQKCSSLNSSQAFYTCIKQKLASALNNVADYNGDIKLVSDYLILVNDSPANEPANEKNASSNFTEQNKKFNLNETILNDQQAKDKVMRLNVSSNDVAFNVSGGTNITGEPVDDPDMKYHSRKEKELKHVRYVGT